MTLSILISGAGIGGLTTAIAAARRGHAVSVFERVAAPGEAGAGIQLSPNAMRVLTALGLAGPVEDAGFSPEAAVIRDGRTGRVLLRMPLGAEAVRRWGAPYLHIHRADLLAALSSAAGGAGADLRHGVTVRGYRQDGDRVGVRLSGEGGGEGGGGAGGRDGDVLIAADGIRSPLRREVAGADEARFTGHVAWRAMVPAAALPAGTIPPDATSWTGPGRHVVTYYVRGGDLVNLVAVEAGMRWTEEGWHRPGDPDVLRAAFSGWDRRLVRLLAEVRTPHVWGLFDHAPLPRWTDGRVALLGDAAHPMLPFMAQGAAMAIEDAWVVADRLSSRVEPAVALRAYERDRHARASRVQARSRANGRLFEGRGAAGLASRGKLSLAARLPALSAARFSSVYGTDVTEARTDPQRG